MRDAQQTELPLIADPIVERLHKQREEYMERFQYDFEAIIRDIRSREVSYPSPLVDPPASKPERQRRDQTIV